MNQWYQALRPDEEQFPPLNLGHDAILPLEEITFEMHDGYGAKCANLATMNHFGFPEGTIPDGFGIPFHYYREFMKFNGLFEEVELLLELPHFKADRNFSVCVCVCVCVSRPRRRRQRLSSIEASPRTRY